MKLGPALCSLSSFGIIFSFYDIFSLSLSPRLSPFLTLCDLKATFAERKASLGCSWFQFSQMETFSSSACFSSSSPKLSLFLSATLFISLFWFLFYLLFLCSIPFSLYSPLSLTSSSFCLILFWLLCEYKWMNNATSSLDYCSVQSLVWRGHCDQHVVLSVQIETIVW